MPPGFGVNTGGSVVQNCVERVPTISTSLSDHGKKGGEYVKPDAKSANVVDSDFAGHPEPYPTL